MNNELLFAIIGGVGAMLGWGISDFFAKKTVDKIGDTVALFWMQALGIIPLCLFFLFNFDVSGITLSQVPYVILWGLVDGAGYLMFYRALERGKVSIVSPIVASYSAFSVLISALVFGEQLSSRILLVLGVIFTGIMLTSIDFKEVKKDGFDKKDLVKGVPEALIGVVLFSIWFPFWDNFVSGGNWLVLVILLRSVITLFLFGVTKVSKLSIVVKDSQVVKWLMIIGLLDAIAYLTLTWGYGVTSYTSLISVLSATFSLPTLLLARIFLKEKLQLSQWGGIALILLGLALLGVH
jgi:drug/metabolite transporter (DMT)-like permease